MMDLIDRQAAIDAVHEEFDECIVWDESGEYTANAVERILDRVPPAEPEEAITVTWINKHLEWLDNCDNDFAQLAKVSIRAMVEIWKKDRI